MEIRDDEHFEKYLKHFRPVEPQRILPAQMQGQHDGMIWLTAAAAILIVVAFAMQIGGLFGGRKTPVITAEVEHRPVSVPLTLSRANLQLARSKSVKAALDEIAFQRPAVTVPSGSQSALEVLGKEKTGL